MPDEVVEDQAGAEAQQSGQAAPEVTPASAGGGEASQAATQAQQTPSWEFGGNKYNDPNKLYEAARKWEADITRKSQERSAKDKEVSIKMAQYERVIEAVRSDETLRQQVLQKIQAGQTPQQAVSQVAQQNLPPEVLERIETLEARERERIEDQAIEQFQKSHKDLTDPDWDAMGEWLDKNQEEIGHLKPARQLAMAYAEVVVPKRDAKLIELGAKQKEEEVKKGEKSSFLGSQAPTAQAKPAGAPERKRGMTPAQEREYALKVFRASGRKS